MMWSTSFLPGWCGASRRYHVLSWPPPRMLWCSQVLRIVLNHLAVLLLVAEWIPAVGMDSSPSKNPSAKAVLKQYHLPMPNLLRITQSNHSLLSIRLEICMIYVVKKARKAGGRPLAGYGQWHLAHMTGQHFPRQWQCLHEHLVYCPTGGQTTACKAHPAWLQIRPSNPTHDSVSHILYLKPCPLKICSVKICSDIKGCYPYFKCSDTSTSCNASCITDLM